MFISRDNLRIFQKVLGVEKKRMGARRKRLTKKLAIIILAKHLLLIEKAFFFWWIIKKHVSIFRLFHLGVNKQVIFLQRLFNPLFVCGERKGRVGREQVRKEEKKNRIIEIVGLKRNKMK